jgi:hypothetical protein
VSEAEIVPDPERDAALAYGRELEIAALEGNAALAVLRKALDESQAAMEAQIGANVMRSNREVNQRQLDYTRGYFEGARFWLNGRITAAKQIVAQQAREDEDPRPAGRIDPRTGDPTEGDGRA